MSKGALLYGRQSHASKKSIDQQEEIGRARIAVEGYDLRGVYRDTISASRFTKQARGDWSRLLADLQRPDVDLLWLWESSRGDRTLTSWAGMLDTARKHGVRIYVETHERAYDMNNPRDWKTLAEDGVTSAYEVELTSQRVRRDVAAAAGRGLPHGKNLYGYRRLYRMGTNGAELDKIVIRDDQAAIIREAAQRVVEGESRRSIAESFNRRGVPVARPGVHGPACKQCVHESCGKIRRRKFGRNDWNLARVRQMVTNPAYAGKRVHRGKIVGDAVWPPILDDVTYWTCVNLCNRSSQSRDGMVKHLLSGIALCGHTLPNGNYCDAPMRVLKNRGYYSYTCSRSAVKDGDGNTIESGFHVTRRADYLEEYITEVALERLSRPDALERLTPVDRTEDVQAAEAEAEQKRATLSEYIDLATTGEISAVSFAQIEKQLVADITAAEDRARRAAVSHVLRDALGPDLPTRWAGYPVQKRREIIAALMTVRVMPTVSGRHGFDPTSVTIGWLTQE